MDRTTGDRRCTRRSRSTSRITLTVCSDGKSCFAFIEPQVTSTGRRAARPYPRIVEAAAAFRSARKRSSPDDLGRISRRSDQVGFYQRGGRRDGGCTGTAALKKSASDVVCSNRGRMCLPRGKWHIRLAKKFPRICAPNNCRHECDKCNLHSIQFRCGTVNGSRMR